MRWTVPPGRVTRTSSAIGPLRVGNRLEHVPADGEVEGAVGEGEPEHAAVLEPDAIAEVPGQRARPLEVHLEDVHAEYGRVREGLREASRRLAGAAAGIEDARARGEGVAAEERQLLRPDRLRLGGEGADHRLVGHLHGLGVQLVHGRDEYRRATASVGPGRGRAGPARTRLTAPAIRTWTPGSPRRPRGEKRRRSVASPRTGTRDSRRGRARRTTRLPDLRVARGEARGLHVGRHRAGAYTFGTGKTSPRGRMIRR